MPSRTVLRIHNAYRQPGGEDQVFAAENALLEQAGHCLVRYEDSNARIENGIRAGFESIWNRQSYRKLQTLVRFSRPEVAHVHNTFPLISPAAYYALRTHDVPTVQTLHNYRLLCPGATFFRNGQVCEECLLNRSLRPALAHACYRDNRPATTAVAAMLKVHRAANTWDRMVDVFIALSEFARQKFIQGGLCADRIVVKSNFVAKDPGPGDGRGNYALFVGRLSDEKGIGVLAQAWASLTDIPLFVAGSGPLEGTAWPSGVTVLGPVSRDQVFALMRNAKALIFPSICYECAPMTIIEAFATGLPVIASNLGSIPEFVEHRRTGLLFKPGDADDLARNVRWVFDHPEDWRPMRDEARREYEQKYTPERNYRMLMDIYDLARENSRRWRKAAS